MVVDRVDADDDDDGSKDVYDDSTDVTNPLPNRNNLDEPVGVVIHVLDHDHVDHALVEL